MISDHDDDSIPNIGPEEVVWAGTPSHWTNLGVYLLCILFSPLIIPAIYGLFRYFLLRSHRYELTNQRLKETYGVFNKRRDDLELYRIKDISVEQPFQLNLVGLGNIVLDTSDKTTPKVTIQAIKAFEVVDLLRDQVERIRMLKKTREVDME